MLRIAPAWLRPRIQESSFRAEAVSPADAVGLMQVRPGTAGDTARARGQSISVAGLKRPETNLDHGQAFIELIRRSNATRGQLPKVIAAYNAGPVPVDRWNYTNDKGDPLLWIESIPYWETRYYVPAVLRNMWVYQGLAGAPQPTLRALAEHRWPTFPTTPAQSLAKAQPWVALSRVYAISPSPAGGRHDRSYREDILSARRSTGSGARSPTPRIGAFRGDLDQPFVRASARRQDTYPGFEGIRGWLGYCRRRAEPSAFNGRRGLMPRRSRTRPARSSNSGSTPKRRDPAPDRRIGLATRSPNRSAPAPCARIPKAGTSRPTMSQPHAEAEPAAVFAALGEPTDGIARPLGDGARVRSARSRAVCRSRAALTKHCACSKARAASAARDGRETLYRSTRRPARRRGWMARSRASGTADRRLSAHRRLVVLASSHEALLRPWQSSRPRARRDAQQPPVRFNLASASLTATGSTGRGARRVAPRRTTVTIEKPRTILTRNSSPDIGFDRSINPYAAASMAASIASRARPTPITICRPGGFRKRLFAKPTPPIAPRGLVGAGYEAAPIALGNQYRPLPADRGTVADHAPRSSNSCSNEASLLDHHQSAASCATWTSSSPRRGSDWSRWRSRSPRSIPRSTARSSRARRPRASASPRSRRWPRPASPRTSPSPPSFPTSPTMNSKPSSRPPPPRARAAASICPSACRTRSRALVRAWLDEHYPDRAAKVMANDPLDARRQGQDPTSFPDARQGVWADLLATRFGTRRRRARAPGSKFAHLATCSNPAGRPAAPA